MTWAKLLALVDGDVGSEAVIRAALALGRELPARIELLHVETPGEAAVPITAEAMSSGALAQLLESQAAAGRARAAAAEALYGRLCRDAGLPLCEADAGPEPGQFRVAFRHVVGREDEEIAWRGRLADLILIGGASDAEERLFVPGLEAALFASGRPVLLVPPGLAALPEIAETLFAVAWDGSREAAGAATAALPLLTRARGAIVLAAGTAWTEAAPDPLVAFLCEHGVAATGRPFTHGRGGLGEALLAEAANAGAGAFVMGAYGHSRLRELVLGGVTRSVIATAALPVLMAH